MDRIAHDIVVVGGGGAGLRAAIAGAEANKKISIAILSKVYPMRSHTVSAEGGLAAVLKKDDTLESHGFDTVKGSDYLADQDAVELFVQEAPKEVIQLEHWGLPFSREPDGSLATRWFGGMSVKRTLFAADKIGFHMLHTLFQTSLKHDNIVRYDEYFVTNLTLNEGRVAGLMALDLKNGELATISAKAVIIATGGPGRVYRFTSNASTCTGDGMALAYRAGVPLKDMEFIQYHPTCLPGTGILMTEAARGEGGYLINKDGERFLKRYVPNKMELGPRDIISRAILTEIQEGRGMEGPYGSYVYLDLRHLGEEVIRKKLPFVKELAEKYSGINPMKDPIPVRPGTHYVMGGVHTDKQGFTGLPGLFAAGEAACVSINGANRLGSNSLTECLVFGRLAGEAAAKYVQSLVSFPYIDQEAVRVEEKRIFDGVLRHEGGKENVAGLREELQETMEENVGVFREEGRMAEACKKIGEVKERFPQVTVSDRDRVFNTELMHALELEYMLDVAEAIAFSALSRRETRGSHYRLDYPERDDKAYLSHTMVSKTDGEPRLEYLPAVITKWQPAARTY